MSLPGYVPRYTLTQAKNGGGALARRWNLNDSESGSIVAQFYDRKTGALCEAMLNAIIACLDSEENSARERGE